MKHNTHIYLAAKGIEFLYEGLGNLHYATTNTMARSATRKKRREEGKVLQRMLMHYQDMIYEASWAPDDIINDKSQYHVFKLFTDREFPDSSHLASETHGAGYYRIKGGGGLPYKVDHLARVISDMDKLRKYNDQCTMKQIMYQFLLLSHYIADAHVPMHCDLRDDPPSASDDTKPRNGEYYSDELHGDIEELWEDAVIPVAIDEEIIKKKRAGHTTTEIALSPQIKFDVTIPEHRELIIPYVIPNDNLMQYMINLCIQTKETALQLFPLDDPSNWDEEAFPQITREIFARTIGNLITVWIWIWGKK